MNYFFLSDNLLNGSRLTLSEEEGRHAIKVLRSGIGDKLFLINGMGQLAEASIVSIKGSVVEVIIENVSMEKLPEYQLVIGISILKKRERLEWFIEKAVELAAHKIILFSSRHSEKSHIDDKRLRKIAISALKQSGNLWLPEIIVNMDFQKLISEKINGAKYIAHCKEGEKSLLNKVYKKQENAFVFIGPEGDFSDTEIVDAIEKDFVPVSLGNLRLRAETAALAALMTLQLANQNQ